MSQSQATKWVFATPSDRARLRKSRAPSSDNWSSSSHCRVYLHGITNHRYRGMHLKQTPKQRNSLGSARILAWPATSLSPSSTLTLLWFPCAVCMRHYTFRGQPSTEQRSKAKIPSASSPPSSSISSDRYADNQVLPSALLSPACPPQPCPISTADPNPRKLPFRDNRFRLARPKLWCHSLEACVTETALAAPELRLQYGIWTGWLDLHLTPYRRHISVATMTYIIPASSTNADQPAHHQKKPSNPSNTHIHSQHPLPRPKKASSKRNHRSRRRHISHDVASRQGADVTPQY